MVTYNFFRAEDAKRIQVAKIRLDPKTINIQCGEVVIKLEDELEATDLKKNLLSTDFFKETGNRYSVMPKDEYSINFVNYQDCTVIEVSATYRPIEAVIERD